MTHLTPKDSAAALSVSLTTARVIAAAIGYVAVGRCVRVSRLDFELWLQAIRGAGSRSSTADSAAQKLS